MSDSIKHECGLAALRLLKPLSYYQEKYGSMLYGLEAMYLLLEKQHNRGQDGAGIASLQLHQPPGRAYYGLERVVEPAPPWQHLIKRISGQLSDQLAEHPGLLEDEQALKKHFPFAGEVMLGHVRYGTHGTNTVRTCHPVVRTNNWQTRTLFLAGNFNMTNNDRLFRRLVELGQHPNEKTDTVTILERIGHFLDTAVEDLVRQSKEQGIENPDISRFVGNGLDMLPVLERSAQPWDGGFLLGGMVGHGDLFALRDANGIRPGFYYADDEIVAIASERQAIATTFDLSYDEIRELPPGHTILCKANDSSVRVEPFAEHRNRKHCSFERIYFSRGNDAAIYEERKALGHVIVPRILEAIDNDLDHTVFSYIPNTAKVAFWGMLKGLEDHLNAYKAKAIQELGDASDVQAIQEILNRRVRVENVILKDTKLRTFITDDSARDRMAAHVYDITYGSIERGRDKLVCIDDSIVRGTTLRQSILQILERLGPTDIVIVSSAPQIRYPDCYGIDMSQIGRFIAFQAAISLLKQRGQQHVIDETYHRSVEAKTAGEIESENFVKAIYAPFRQEELSAEIARSLGADLNCGLKLVYQRVDDLHRAIPDHTGDWYFTGDFPTPGGNRVTNQAFINYYEGRDERAY